MLGYDSLRKTIKSSKKFSLKSAKNWKKSLMVSPWFWIKIDEKKMVPNRLLIHSVLFREHCWVMIALKNPQNQQKIGKEPDGQPTVFLSKLALKMVQPTEDYLGRLFSIILRLNFVKIEILLQMD